MKKFSFRGYLWLCLCLFFSFLLSCKALSPANQPNTFGQINWTIEAKILPGHESESFHMISVWNVLTPVFVTHNNLLGSDKEQVSVIYHATSYQIAQHIKAQLLTTGFVENVRITNRSL